MNPKFKMQPTSSQLKICNEADRWNRLFEGNSYYYGHDPGPLARRAVRYHRGFATHFNKPMRALDAGCGEGQDLVFLAAEGYQATGVEFTAAGIAKTKRLLETCGQTAQAAQAQHADLRAYPLQTYDLVLAANSLQFLGKDAPKTLRRLMQAVETGGLMALSLFAREETQAEIEGTIWRISLPDLLKIYDGWQFLEAAHLWQWNTQTNVPQAFITLIARCMAK